MSLFGRSKKDKPDEVRMHYAPSFSFYVGKRFVFDDPSDVKLRINNNENPIVILVPGPEMMAEPGKWVKALLSVSYLIIFGDEKDKGIKKLYTLFERQVFSPVPKAISGVICLNDESMIRAMAADFVQSGKKNIITIYTR